VHKVDQDSAQAPLLDLRVNGHRFEGALPTGLRIRNSDPAHLAFPAAVEFGLPGGTLLEGSKRLDMRLKNDGWFSRDSLGAVSAVAGSQEHL
jgi:hypothetical protein